MKLDTFLLKTITHLYEKFQEKTLQRTKDMAKTITNNKVTYLLPQEKDVLSSTADISFFQTPNVSFLLYKLEPLKTPFQPYVPISSSSLQNPCILKRVAVGPENTSHFQTPLTPSP